MIVPASAVVMVLMVVIAAAAAAVAVVVMMPARVVCHGWLSDKCGGLQGILGGCSQGYEIKYSVWRKFAFWFPTSRKLRFISNAEGERKAFNWCLSLRDDCSYATGKTS